MKSPEQLPPAESAVSASDGNAPTIQIDNAGSGAASSSAPSATPGAAAAAGNDASSAAVWNNDKRVSGLYTTYNAHNSWMNIAGTGWQHLATANDTACEVMTVFAAHAREKNSRIDYSVDAGLVNEIYIW